MVSAIRCFPPAGEAANLTPAAWLSSLSLRLTEPERRTVEQALALALPAYGERRLPSGEPMASHALGVAAILAFLRMDGDTLAAAVLCALPQCLEDYGQKLAGAFSPDVVRLVEGVSRMALIHGLISDAGRSSPDQAAQAEGLRKMLLAMVEDIRVVLIKLAERVQAMRYLMGGDSLEQKRAAREALEIFAPLANRLGVWQLKWELEDLAFRFLEPELYRDIARVLSERRADRERYIAAVIALLKDELEKAGIQAEVTGRPKHIYSIYRKMKRKGVSFEEIYDARAVRVLVPEVKDCYAALGVVHNLWQPIPKEFDDYIAKPKSNHYRSLHTAVIGPEDKALEVQIRTFEMHQHSELGVAAHWRYKEGGRQDARYDDKIAWLRQLLEWKEEVVPASELALQFKTALFQDTVYTLTPQGKVIALPRGATPVDFAYAVHTELGHRCRGARVNGAIVPLNHSLENGDRVEIITARQARPSRDWLNPELGYLKSPRARAKVRQWFKNLDLEQTIAAGRAIVERELQRRGLTAVGLEKLAEKLGFAKVEDLLAALGGGEIGSRQLGAALAGGSETREQAELPPVRKATPISGSGILVGGVGDLMTSFAKCCKPVPPDPIAGYITRGRGVSVHRRDCAALARLKSQTPERLIEAEWSVKPGMSFAVGVAVEARDRPGLLRDIYDIVSRERINITAANTFNRELTAHMFFTLEVADLAQLHRALALIREVPGVIQAVRR